MNYIDWHEKLWAMEQERSVTLESKRMNMESLSLPELVIISAHCTLREASRSLLASDSEAALVQDDGGIMVGVLRKDTLHAAIVTSPGALDTLEVRRIMERNLCVESHTASAAEVVSRMTVGGCAYLLIVNERGLPVAMMTPKLLVNALTEDLECKELEISADIKVEAH